MAGPESERDALIDELAEEFAQRWRRGERPSVQEYIDRHPEVADDIRELLPALVEVEQVNNELGKMPADPPGPGAAAQPLDQIGDFRIIREVGKGGMGVVYEAEQVSLARRVALKLLPKKMVLDGKAKLRFEREAKAAAKLHHSNIVPVFGVGEQDGIPYFVMQFIQGLGLDAVLDELRRMQAKAGSTPAVLPKERISPTPTNAAADMARSLLTGSEKLSAPKCQGNHKVNCEEGNSSSVVLPGQRDTTGSTQQQACSYWHSVARIGIQVAEALDYAHRHGILHRDVKPSNLLLDGQGTVWVTDFGLAKVDDQLNLTDTGDILGTLRYMPPEAFEGHSDARGDVYALGLTLYELLAFRPAFDETDRAKLIKQVSSADPSRLRKLNPQMPLDLETVVSKAIEREPPRRYATAGLLAADLRRFLNDEPIHARRLSSAERLLRWGRRNKMASFVAVLLLGLVAGLGLAARRLQRERDAVLAEQRRANAAERKTVAARTEALFTAAPESVPILLASLQDHRETVLADLRRRRGEWPQRSVEDLRLTVTRSVLGEDCLLELCERVEHTQASESYNLLLGLTACDRERVVAELNRRYQSARPGEGRTRLCIAMLTFGDPRAAQAELALRHNPTDRVRFIDEFRGWHGELTRVPEFLRSIDDPAFRSGICLAVGGIAPDKIAAATRQSLEEVLTKLYTNASDGGTHGAAGWALQNVSPADRGGAVHSAKRALPDIAGTHGPFATRKWFVNRQGMTMIGLQPGFFEPDSYEDHLKAERDKPLVVLTRPFFMLDQEVTSEWYRRFLDSDDHPAGEELARFPRNLRLNLPVASVDWIGTVLYCNWLSRREGRTPCYHVSADAEDLSSAVTADFDANGYRLPTDAEWEYAFRTGSTTRFVTGDDVERMGGYGRIFAERSGRGKELMPNPWGLFDLLGNEWEMTWDLPNVEDQPLPAIDPVGTVGKAYAQRGGTAEGGLFYLYGSFRMRPSITELSGFRVVCGPLKRGPASSKGAQILAALDNTVGPPPLAVLELRAQWHAENSHWRAALDELERARDRWPSDNLLGLRAAPLYIAAGDGDGYRRLRRALLKRFKSSTNGVDLERTAKACLLLPGSAEETNDCFEMTERAYRHGEPESFKISFALAAGFAQYRKGDFEAASKHLADLGDGDWGWAIPADLLRAMICCRQGKVDDARAALARACQAMDANIPTIAEAGNPWHDVLICRILRREAEALLAR